MVSTRFDRIPDTLLDGVEAVLRLEVNQYEMLVDALQATPPSLPFDHFSNAIAENANVPLEDADQIVDLLASLMAVFSRGRVTFDQSVLDFLGGIALRRVASSVSPLTSDETTRITDRLRALVDASTGVVTVYKATELQYFEGKQIIDMQIVTDIRPIFSRDVSETPNAAIISNLLRINYREGTRRHDFVVPLDAQDLESLKTLIERAGQKTQSIKALLSATSIQLLEEKGE